MSTVMVMLKETEQLHKSNMTDEKTVTPTSDRSFDFDKTSTENNQATSDDVSSQSSVEYEIFPLPSDDELYNAENIVNMPNKLQNEHEKGQICPPPSEPVLEKHIEFNNPISDVRHNQIDSHGPFEQSNIYPEGETKRHDCETSDDDLLEELDKVVTASNGKDDASESETDNILLEQESNLMSKKMEALKRRLDYTIQERKHLEIENINLERKIDALLRNHALESKEILSSMEVQKEEMEELKKRLYQQKEAGRLDVLKCQAEHQKEVENLQKKIEECKKEKDDVVVRFAVAEQKSIDMADKLQRSEVKLKEWSKEREAALTRWKTMKAENKRAFDICEAQKNEINQLKKDNERLKESEASSDNKLKWHQNKLKVEQDGHKETSAKLLEQNKIMVELQARLFTMFETVRSVYSVLQELHTCQSSQQAPPPTLPPSPKQDASVTQLLPIIMKDLQTLLWKQREMLAETRTYKDKIHCLELERLSQQDELVSLKDAIKTQKQDNSALKTEISRLQDMEKEQQSLIVELESISKKASDLEASNVELSTELKSSQSWKAENMEFNSRLMSSNSELKATNDALKQELECKSSSFGSVQDQFKSLQIQLTQLSHEKDENSRESSAVIENLKTQLLETNGKVEDLKTKKEELEDEIKTIKRRYTAMVKDLKRHMTSGGRQPLTSDDLKSQVDTNSLCSSHGGSSLSLDTHAVNHHQPSTPPSQVHSAVKPADQSPANQCESAANGEEEEEDPNIILLLKHLERKTRKVSFLKEHVDHLTEELHRKSKIIREYALREESGTLVPEASDKNKAQISRKGGIMASLYSLNAKDSGMTLSLSMEINQKLQALVEDSLLKNIKYKESMDLLGHEIEWLSKENKSLRSQLDGKESAPPEMKTTSVAL